LAALYFNNAVIYVSFSETGAITARNSFFQSLTTAFRMYCEAKSKGKARICFYFLPFSGNVETKYFYFMYRLMLTVGVEFLNADKILSRLPQPFSTIDDIIAARELNRGKNRGNNSTYITRDSAVTQIYGKTYGASKKESALLCIAASLLSTNVELYEVCEGNLSELPAPDLKIITELGNVKIISTDYTMERKEFEENNSLRSPLFKYNLLEKLGPKKCAMCDCAIPELIEGAHIWPVFAIKRDNNIDITEKLQYATSGDNGIWLCENHHKMFDENLITINFAGEVEVSPVLKPEDKRFIDYSTIIRKLSSAILTAQFCSFLRKRYI
jgi:hypothetical protein